MKLKRFFKRLSNGFLYLLALVFLAYHLVPLAALAYSKIHDQTSSQVQLDRLAASAQCQVGDGTYDLASFGSPLEPLYTSRWEENPNDKPVVGKNLINNPTFNNEIDKVTKLPDGWIQNQFGRTAAKLTVEPTGYDAGPSVKVNITSRDDGDAKWVMEPIDVKPGQYFRFEDHYKSDATSNILLDILDQDGQHNYITLATLESTKGEWNTFRQSFVIPPYAEQLQVAHALDHIGSLQTDTYNLVRQPLPQFKRGLVTVTFDDGWRSIHDNALPLLDKYDIKTTQFIISGVVGDKSYMTPAMISEFASKGHEIASHTVKHEDLSTASEATIQSTLAVSKDTLNLHYDWTANNFAPPYGKTNNLSRRWISQCYQSMRSTDTGYNAADYDRYNLKVFNIEVNTKPEEIATAVRFARDNKLWLILVYHEVDNRSASDYAASLNDLEKHLQILKQEKVPVVTLEQGLIETIPQHN